ncbi:MAG: hypothetical protein JW782_07375 [Candidatus Saganbacteria bacterium]|nr:hypothetical protein [Candidatus Saganbacteria bacterium]
MSANTLQKINEIEVKAAETIKAAQQTAAHELRQLREEQENSLAALHEKLKNQEAELIRAARQAAEAEGKQLAAETERQLKDLKSTARSRLAQAKKEILACLS